MIRSASYAPSCTSVGQPCNLQPDLLLDVPITPSYKFQLLHNWCVSSEPPIAISDVVQHVVKSWVGNSDADFLQNLLITLFPSLL